MGDNQIQIPTGSHQSQPPLPSQGGNAYTQKICLYVIRCYLSGQSLVTLPIKDLREYENSPPVCKHATN